MHSNLTTYTPGNDVIRRADARAKILLMIVFSIAVLCVKSWIGILLLCIGCAICAHVAKLRLAQSLPLLVPFTVMIALLVVFNAFVIGDASRMSVQVIPLVPQSSFIGGDAGIAAGQSVAQLHILPLFGSLALSLEGFLRGLFLSLRLALLVVASLVLTTTTSSTQITQGISLSLHPLSRFGIQTRDACTVLSIALRFIPETIDQFQDIKRAQRSRGAQFNSSNLTSKLKSWQMVFIPLFASMFRKAEHLASAMDARCYGMGETTYLHNAPLHVSRIMATLVLCVLLIAIAIIL